MQLLLHLSIINCYFRGLFHHDLLTIYDVETLQAIETCSLATYQLTIDRVDVNSLAVGSNLTDVSCYSNSSGYRLRLSTSSVNSSYSEGVLTSCQLVNSNSVSSLVTLYRSYLILLEVDVE